MCITLSSACSCHLRLDSLYIVRLPSFRCSTRKAPRSSITFPIVSCQHDVGFRQLQQIWMWICPCPMLPLMPTPVHTSRSSLPSHLLLYSHTHTHIYISMARHNPHASARLKSCTQVNPANEFKLKAVPSSRESGTIIVIGNQTVSFRPAAVGLAHLMHLHPYQHDDTDDDTCAHLSMCQSVCVSIPDCSCMRVSL